MADKLIAGWVLPSPSGNWYPFESIFSPSDYASEASGTKTITFKSYSNSGRAITVGGDTVVFATDVGSIGAVTDHNDGSYTATYSVPEGSSIATITATQNGNPISATATVSGAESSF